MRKAHRVEGARLLPLPAGAFGWVLDESCGAREQILNSADRRRTYAGAGSSGYFTYGLPSAVFDVLTPRETQNRELTLTG